jgi:macrolide transport system ATP-binding/permease protein
MKLFRRIDYWLNHRKREAELAEELEFHRSQGGPAELGNATLAREDARAIWIWPWLESVGQDLRYALRNLRRQPGFALLALLTLGVAIGLNTSLFTVFDAVALRTWPVKDPKQVVRIFSVTRHGPRGFSLAEFRYLRDHSKTFSGIVAVSDVRVRFGWEAFGKATISAFVPHDYFQVLGVQMERGRGFLPDEERMEQPESVMVLGYALWRDQFASDPEIVGKTIRVSEIPFIVVGVAPEDFTGSVEVGTEQLWMPLPAMLLFAMNLADTRSFLTNPQDCCIGIAGRVAAGVSQGQARAELDVLSRQFRAENRLDASTVRFVEPTLLAGHSKRKSILPVFALMFTGVILVLLLACANVSNLLIARAAARQREIAVRRAIGADRARIIRQLLTEGLVIAAGASALGVALGWKLPAYVFVLMGEGPGVNLTPDFATIGYASALAAIACIAFALAPALHGTRPRSSRAKLPLRSFLLGSQVAISVVLLIGAGLMVAGVQHARDHDLGFRVADINAISIDLPAHSYDTKRLVAFSAQLQHELESVAPGRFGITAREPLANSHWATEFRLPQEPAATAHDVEFQEVAGDYFGMLGIPMMAGRKLQPADLASHAIVVNETFAKRYFDGANPVGKTIITGTQTREIVGVARDAYLTGLDQFVPLFFQPFTGAETPRVLARTDFPGAADLVAQTVKGLEARARIQSVPLSENMARLLQPIQVMAGIAGALGGFALLLAVIGMSGVFAYVVQQRTQEIGIRMALGAEPKQVIALVLAGTARAAAIGLAIGYVAAAGAAKLLAEYLYGVSPYDPRAYFQVAAILAISALAAAYLPARRATRVDPLTALRVE